MIGGFHVGLSTSNSHKATRLCLAAAVCLSAVLCARIAQAQDVKQSQDDQISESPESCERPGFGWPITGLVVSTGGMLLGDALILSTAFEESSRSTRTRIGVGTTLIVGGIVGVSLSAWTIRKRRKERRAIDARCRAIAPTPSYLTRIRLPSEPHPRRTPCSFVGRQDSILPEPSPVRNGAIHSNGTCCEQIGPRQSTKSSCWRTLALRLPP